MAHKVFATTEDLLKHTEMHSTPGFVCFAASVGSRCVTVWSQQLPANGENPGNSNNSSRSQMECVPKSAHCVSCAPSHFHSDTLLGYPQQLFRALLPQQLEEVKEIWT